MKNIKMLLNQIFNQQSTDVYMHIHLKKNEFLYSHGNKVSHGKVMIIT